MKRYEDAQRRMLAAFDKARLDGKGSGKFNGDVCCRILKEFLAKELSPRFKVTEPGAYVYSCPREFDLLIVARDARRRVYTNAFEAKTVKCAIEVKANGLSFSGDPDKDARKLKEAFRRFPAINHVYFTFQETSPRKSRGIDYWGKTRDGLKPFKAFRLRNRRGTETQQGEWGRFVEYVKSIL